LKEKTGKKKPLKSTALIKAEQAYRIP